MTCASYRRWLSPYVDARLTSHERAKLEDHLRGCAGCRRELDSLRKMLDSLRRMEPLQAPDLLVGVRARLARAGWRLELARRLDDLVGLRWPWRGLALAMTALVVVVVVGIPREAAREGQRQRLVESAERRNAASLTNAESAPEKDKSFVVARLELQQVERAIGAERELTGDTAQVERVGGAAILTDRRKTESRPPRSIPELTPARGPELGARGPSVEMPKASRPLSYAQRSEAGWQADGKDAVRGALVGSGQIGQAPSGVFGTSPEGLAGIGDRARPDKPADSSALLAGRESVDQDQSSLSQARNAAASPPPPQLEGAEALKVQWRVTDVQRAAMEIGEWVLARRGDLVTVDERHLTIQLAAADAAAFLQWFSYASSRVPGEVDDAWRTQPSGVVGEAASSSTYQAVHRVMDQPTALAKAPPDDQMTIEVELVPSE